MTTGNGTELMAVDSLEYDPFPIEQHDTVFNLKASETGFLGNNFNCIAGFVINSDEQVIKVWYLGAP